ncbi:uncharacterized protein LOC129224625 isoform X2 [Uloborus diversus]|uniref:uncharacterized protein LOC129224625 isoform X2 n=1 Tax=Uloborus diversus TaxID=327109 RepID=UPI0024095FFB|nr:uncharacterized protein LOC129224625 isoform X2 [Uloborus diversus]
MSDVIFMVDDPPQRFPCHKVILGMGSHVFETMLFGKMPEKSPIFVPDVTAAGFEIMLQSIANCSRLEIPTKYKYDGNMSTFTNVEHYQKIDVSVSGPDITILGFNIAFKPIPCYSAPDRCLKLEFLINNYSTNAQTRIESSIAAKENNANQIEQEVILDDFIVISEGDICEIVAIVSGEGVRIMHCVEDRFTKNCGSSRLSCSLNASDDALLFPVKEILCKQT